MAKKRYYDSGMIKGNHNAMANLPQEVIIKEYPKVEYYSYDLNDDIRGIDVQMNDDLKGARRKKGKYPEKY